jgi:hypothetical protein
MITRALTYNRWNRNMKIIYIKQTITAFLLLGFVSLSHAAIILKAGDVVGKYNYDVAVSSSPTLRGSCKPASPIEWECDGSSTPRQAQVEFVSSGVDMEAYGGVSVALASDRYQIDSLSTLNAQITGQLEYDGTMYVFQNNGVDLFGFIEIPTPQIGTKVQAIITVALVDVTDPGNTYEVGNTTILDAECAAEYEIALGISILANKCTHVLQPTYSFNAMVQPDHTYEIVTELRCETFIGSPGLNVVGCKFGPEWPEAGDLTVLNFLGSLGAYASTISAIGRPGGLNWANSTISLGQDARADAQAERNRIISRLETTLGLISSLENRARLEQLKLIETMISDHDVAVESRTNDLKLELEALLAENGQKIDGLETQNTEIQQQQETIKGLISDHDVAVESSTNDLKLKLDELETLVKLPLGKRKRR